MKAETQMIRKAIAEIRLRQLRSRREEMIQWLITKKKFNPKAAPKCIDNFLDSLAYVLESTGDLP